MKTKIELKVEKLQNKNILLDGSAEKKKKKASGEKFLSAAECQDKKKMMLRCSQRPHKGFIQTHLRLIWALSKGAAHKRGDGCPTFNYKQQQQQ